MNRVRKSSIIILGTLLGSCFMNEARTQQDKVGEIRRFGPPRVTEFTVLVVDHKEFCTSLALYKDGKRAFSGGMDFTVRSWDLESGNEIRQYAGCKSRINCLAVSPDGKLLFAGSGDYLKGEDGNQVIKDGRFLHTDCFLRIWDIETGKEARRFEALPKPVAVPVRNLAISLSGRHVLCATDAVYPYQVRLWDLTTTKELRSFPTLKGGGFYSVVFLPDNRHALVGGDYSEYEMVFYVHVLDTQTGRSLRTFRGRCVACSPDGRYALTSICFSSMKDHSIRLFEVATGKELGRLEGHTNEVAALAITPDGQGVSASWDGTIRVWNLGLPKTNAGR